MSDSRFDPHTTPIATPWSASSAMSLHAGDALSDVLPDPSSGERRLVGVADGMVVGTVRLIASPRRTMIYGFVVDPARRGQRIGTRMLATVLDQLRSEGTREVGLEVDPGEHPGRAALRAIRLRDCHHLSIFAPRVRDLTVLTGHAVDARRLLACVSHANVGAGGAPTPVASPGGSRRRASSSRMLSSPLRIAHR